MGNLFMSTGLPVPRRSLRTRAWGLQKAYSQRMFLNAEDIDGWVTSTQLAVKFNPV